MNVIETLTSLGFSEREIGIYLALLSLGPSSIRDISAKSGCNRGTTYEVLKTLQQKGIVSYFPRGKRRYFSAEEPQRFLRLAEERRDELQETIARLQSDVIPELLARRPELGNANVHYYEGDDGIELVLRDLLHTVGESSRKEYYVYSSKPIRPYLYRPFPGFTRQRIKRGIRVKVIAIGEGGEETELSERKWLPNGSSPSAGTYIAVYPPKCAYISLAYEDYPAAVVIDAEEIAEAQALIFRTLWSFL